MKFYMLVLALDTTTRQGSIALTRQGTLLGTYRGDPTVTHGVRLPGDLMRLLDAHALRLADVALFAVAAGPGSFTGLRIGIAALQGLAIAHDRPLIGISALDALHAAARSSSRSAHPSALRPPPSGLPGVGIAAWMDAQRGQVFSALYLRDGTVEGPTAEAPVDVLGRWSVEARWRPHLFLGDGALAYRDTIKDAFPEAEILEDTPPLAPHIASLAEAQVRRHGPSAPDAIRPIYIRRTDVELARDRAHS